MRPSRSGNKARNAGHSGAASNPATERGSRCIYPFILLNLAFSLQSAYAAPLILLAQTRQADRDAAHALADAEHREALRSASEGGALAANQTTLLVEMLRRILNSRKR